MSGNVARSVASKKKNYLKTSMFYVHEDGIEEISERTPLVPPSPSAPHVYEEFPRPKTWRRYIQVEMKVPRVQTIAGVLLGLLLLGMVLMLVAEAIRESREPDPFLIDFTTSPRPFTGASPRPLLATGLLKLEDKDMRDSWLEGEALVAYRKNLELMLFQKGIVPKKNSPSSLLQKFQRHNQNSRGMQDCELVIEHMKKALGGCIDTALIPDHCKPDTPNTCDDTAPYRTFNGSCNNLEHADWGMAMTSFRRLLKPEYADGVSLPRVSITGDELPNARHLSNELYTHHTKPRCNSTVLTLYFGLFVDHDIVRFSSKSGHNGSPISCCNPEIESHPNLLHPECMAIRLPEDDPFFGPLGVRCMDMIRSEPVPGECPGRREQMNLVSSFLDGSGVYGSFEETNTLLRSYVNGQLRVCHINNTEMLPKARRMTYQCGFPQNGQFCFRAGDMRVNEQVELTAIHAIWMREHNRVALRLHALNPLWNDEKLFQEGRRIIVAQLQHIVYREFLPLMLGEDIVKVYGLGINSPRDYTGYEPTTDPSIYNVFGAAAFKVGHSLIEGMLELIGPGYTSERQIPLHTAFLNPHIFYEKGIDLLLRGLVRDKAQTVDSFITDEVRNRLFQPFGGQYGMDLSAIGIQRARDHGIPGYTQWRKFCQLSEVNSWEDLFNVMDSAHAQRLRKNYVNVEDVDVIPAALSENHLPGALVGPLHACLIARQFYHTRFGDRFWFEAKDQAGSFTPGQLEELYKSSMARLFCDNSDHMKEVQKWPMRAISKENPVMQCSDVPEVDLRLWTERLHDSMVK